MRLPIKSLAFLSLLAPVAAQAEDYARKSPLADAPAIRRQVELRDKRFELGAGFGTTLGQDFYNAVLVQGRLGFHLTDWLAVSGTFGHNLTPNYKTSFNNKLLGTLEATTKDRTPTEGQALDGMNKIGQIIGAQVEVTPFAGKLSLFSKVFANYDMYAFGGPGFINFKSDVACDAEDQPSCAVAGMKVGATFGIGIHTFFNDYAALNIELRDILVRNNPAGRDENGDAVANSLDLEWDSNYIVSLNVTFFLPSKATVGP